MILSTRKNSTVEDEFHALPEIIFDVEAVTIEAHYSDELSAHRAKRIWIETLESHFLLDEESDYLIGIQDITEDDQCFALLCHFSSACARYAFWRLTNEQAPEAQYVLETAHIPFTSESWLEFQASGDLRDIARESIGNPLSLDSTGREIRVNKRWFDTFENMLDKLVKSFDPSEK